MKWYKIVLEKYAEFTGRSRRMEYWMFTLMNLLISIGIMIIDMVIGFEIGGFGFGWLSIIYSIFILVPSLAVLVRRLHDTNRSGLWILIGLIPFIGALVLLIFTVMEGNHGPNKYGPDPKGEQHFNQDQFTTTRTDEV